jgi:hypothetical protein
MVGLMGGAEAGYPGVPIINIKNINGGTLGGVRAEDPGAPTINARKR